MDFELSDEQKMLVEGARRYVRENLGLEAHRAVCANDVGFSPQHWAKFAEMGWLALPLPEDTGGLGGSDIDIALLMEELGRGLAVGPYADTAVLGATLIASADDAALRQRLLDNIATGGGVIALAHVEADGRSEYQTVINTAARKTASGWALSGEKTRVHYGAAASHWLVSARLNAQSAGHEPGETDGFGLFVVDRGAPGVSLDSYELVDGARAVDLHFSETPAQVLIGNPARAAATLERALDRTIVALAAAAVGSMENVMALTADYLKQRVQYGQTLSKFQALQHRMAEMFVETDQARSMVLQGLAALGSGDTARRARGASGTKAFVTQAAYFVTGEGIQLHGGIGVTEEYAVGHHYKSIFTYDKRFGDRELHLARSAGLAQGPR